MSDYVLTVRHPITEEEREITVKNKECSGDAEKTFHNPSDEKGDAAIREVRAAGYTELRDLTRIHPLGNRAPITQEVPMSLDRANRMRPESTAAQMYHHMGF